MIIHSYHKSFLLCTSHICGQCQYS
jgi:hypothetical protein